MSLRKRTLTAFFLLAGLFLAIQFAPVIVLFILLQGFILAALMELYNLADKKGLSTEKVLGITGTLLISSSFLFRELGLARVLFAFLAVACITYVVRIRTMEKLAVFPQSIAITVFGAVYLGFTLNYIYWIRSDFGIYHLYFLFGVIFLGDTGAYFIGKPLGRHKMTPIASPNKSWEGSLGGILFACIAAVAARFLFFNGLSLWKAVLCAVIVHAAAQISDPLESLFKRAAGVKDSSNMLPGHGGFLDRIDSLILAAPLFYYLVGILWK